MYAYFRVSTSAALTGPVGGVSSSRNFFCCLPAATYASAGTLAACATCMRGSPPVPASMDSSSSAQSTSSVTPSTAEPPAGRGTPACAVTTRWGASGMWASVRGAGPPSSSSSRSQAGSAPISPSPSGPPSLKTSAACRSAPAPSCRSDVMCASRACAAASSASSTSSPSPSLIAAPSTPLLPAALSDSPRPRWPSSGAALCPAVAPGWSCSE
mmetsp:Transcript_23423/g.60072  ORF Transcript_23423/g.60072 Transcript_23423/m.60072 type:complete len:213 (+) Transcript_23423:353-991(+)